MTARTTEHSYLVTPLVDKAHAHYEMFFCACALQDGFLAHAHYNVVSLRIRITRRFLGACALQGDFFAHTQCSVQYNTAYVEQG